MYGCEYLLRTRRPSLYASAFPSGCLEGVTRGVLLDVAPAAGFAIEEKALRPEDFYAADEVFITSTNRSLVGVAEIEGHHFSAAPGPITKQLEQAFARHMVDYVAHVTAPASAKQLARRWFHC